jgi:DNA polymerase III epsilon subunit-like protein
LKAAKKALIHEQRSILEATGDLEEDRSVVFVSIDFEHECTSAGRGVGIREMGIATFDTRDLIHHEKEPHTIIQTGNYRCQKKRKNGFIFGTPMTVQQIEMGEILKRAIRQYDRNGKLRRVILVAHGVQSELSVMKLCLGIDLTDRDEYPSVVGILDTHELSRATLLQSELAFASYKLQGILETFGVPYKSLHTAGNDANFTLKALLMLCDRCLETGGGANSSQEERLAVLRSIAQASFEPDLKLKRKLKRSVQKKGEVRTKKQNNTPVVMHERVPPGIANSGERHTENNRSVEKTGSRGRGRGRQSQRKIQTSPGVLSFQESLDLLSCDMVPSVPKSITVTASTSTLFVAMDLKVQKKMGPHGKETTKTPKLEGAGFCSFDTESLTGPVDEP